LCENLRELLDMVRIHAHHDVVQLGGQQGSLSGR
jgi:hypothetical protein